jgi:3-oxoadipate enol-lactonase
MGAAGAMRSPDSALDVGRCRLRFRDEGSGRAVLLIHGWGLDLDMWDPQVEQLAAGHRLIRFDRRGFGLSTGEPSLQHDVDDVWTLLDRRRVDRTALVGMSQGARVVLRATLARPDRVACMVLDGPPDELTPEQQAAAGEVPLDEYRALAHRENVEAVRRRWSRHPFTQLRTTDRKAAELVARMVARYPGRDLLQPLSAPCAQMARRLSSLAAPALILNGALDLETRRSAGFRLCQAIAGAQRTLVPDAGHLSNLDNPGFYNSVLSRFFKESHDA